MLVGPPGCGKTTLALALLRQSREDGFTPHIITKMEKLDSASTDLSVTRGQTVLLMDGTLGRVRVDRQQHDLWSEKWPSLMDLVEKGQCRLIIILYTHVLRELRELEGSADSPMSDRSMIMQVGNELDTELRKQMLNSHLEKLHLNPDEHDDLVKTILQTDRSGRGFPWCCHHLVKHWPHSRDLAVFSVPEETLALLLKEMVSHVSHYRLFAAVLALIMRGFHNFLHTPQLTESQPSRTWLMEMLNFQSQSTYLSHAQSVQAELINLGFDAFSDDLLAEYADILQGSILAEDGENFASRTMYNAAALALGRSFRLPTMFKACDVKFLVQHVRTKLAFSGVNGVRETKLAIIVGLPTCCSVSRPVQTTPKDLKALLEKVCAEIISGHLPEICQHPSLQCPEFLLALEQYCQTQNTSVQQVVSVLDPLHSLPLVYWSLFSRCHTLTQWCLKHMTQTKSGMKLLSFQILLASAVFEQMAGESSCRLQPWLEDILTSEYLSYKTDVVELPLLGRGQCLTQETLVYHDLVTGMTLSQRRLHYLCCPSLPFPSDVITIQVTGEKMMVKVRDSRQWYLAYRLLTDRESHRKDQEGNTLLHLAADIGDLDIIQLALKSGDSLLQENYQGKTAYQVAERRRGLLWQRDKRRVYDYFNAVVRGDELMMKTLLCHNIRLEDRDNHGNTGLHVACWDSSPLQSTLCLIQYGADVNAGNSQRSTPLHTASMCGHREKALSLIQHGAHVNAEGGLDQSTPLHNASLRGHNETVLCLIQHGADVNTTDWLQSTPLHNACREGRHQTALCLIQQGAHVNAQDRLQTTPLHRACKSGHQETTLCLLQHGADVNSRTQYEFTPLYEACTNGHHQTALCLIQHGADINAVAPWRSLLENIPLVRNVVPFFRRDDNGTTRMWTPLDWARHCHHGESSKIIQLLLQHGATSNIM